MTYTLRQRVLKRWNTNGWEALQEMLAILSHQRSANPNDSEILSDTGQNDEDQYKWYTWWGGCREREQSSIAGRSGTHAGEDVGKGEESSIAGKSGTHGENVGKGEESSTAGRSGTTTLDTSSSGSWDLPQDTPIPFFRWAYAQWTYFQYLQQRPWVIPRWEIANDKLDVTVNILFAFLV